MYISFFLSIVADFLFLPRGWISLNLYDLTRMFY